MKRLAAVLQIAGLATVAVGVGLIFPPAGVIIGGAGLFAVGFVEEARSVR